MRTLIALALSLNAAIAAASGGATMTTQTDFKVGARPILIVDSAAGGVELGAGPAGAVHVEATRKADNEEAARLLEVITTQKGDTVRVQFHRSGGGWRDGASVNFRIRAPADARLEIRTGGGSVATRGFTGGAKVDIGGGGIEVTDAAGTLALRSGGGGIEVHRLQGTVDIFTGGGSVHVDGALHGRNRIHTGGGGITVALPADSKLSVEATSGAGSVRNDFGLRLPEEERGWRPSGRLRGTIGDGSGGSLELRTGGGSIHLEKSIGPHETGDGQSGRGEE